MRVVEEQIILTRQLNFYILYVIIVISLKYIYISLDISYMVIYKSFTGYIYIFQKETV